MRQEHSAGGLRTRREKTSRDSADGNIRIVRDAGRSSKRRNEENNDNKAGSKLQRTKPYAGRARRGETSGARIARVERSRRARSKRTTERGERRMMDKTPLWKIALLYVALKADELIKKIKGIFK